MTTARTSWRMIGAALLLCVGSSGCAWLVGIEEFPLADTKGAGGSGDGGGSAASGGGGGSAASGGGGGGGGTMGDVCTAVNGCTRAGATDLRAADPVVISFSDAGYNPPCSLIRSGQVTFTGDFVQVPIAGGVFPNEDPSSPIKNPDPIMTETVFDLSEKCSFPYFSPMTGKKGAIFLE